MSAGGVAAGTMAGQNTLSTERFVTMREKITPHWEHVYGSTWCMVTGPARIPVYMLPDNRAILLDSGYSTEEADLFSLLEEKNLTVAAILTSHTHPDHIGNHNALCKRFGCRVYMTQFAAETCRDPLVLYTSLGGRAGYRSLRDRELYHVSEQEIIPWEAGEITVEGAVFRTLPTPGHCVQHMSFITPDNVAYLGDAILSADALQNLRLVYTTGLEEDMDTKRALKNLNCRSYILSHNAVVEDIAGLVDTAMASIDSRLSLLEQAAADPVGMDDLVRNFTALSGANLNSARSVRGIYFNAQAYVGYLVDTGRLVLDFKDGYITYQAKKAM
jgi:glyoxylase-like metal-dependent hydrolase (beta-lactamase superfamily II)